MFTKEEFDAAVEIHRQQDEAGFFPPEGKTIKNYTSENTAIFALIVAIIEDTSTQEGIEEIHTKTGIAKEKLNKAMIILEAINRGVYLGYMLGKGEDKQAN